MEVVAWVTNNWQTQWISGYVTADVGRLEVQVGGLLLGKVKGLLGQAVNGLTRRRWMRLERLHNIAPRTSRKL
jgi:hypothetical protein